VSEQIEPCPNPKCGEDALVTFGERDARYVKCTKCQMEGPTGKTDEEAIVGWNLLPRLTPAAQAVLDAAVPIAWADSGDGSEPAFDHRKIWDALKAYARERRGGE
jgi:hypothetical protein